jgi:hypothetical protein
MTMKRLAAAVAIAGGPEASIFGAGAGVASADTNTPPAVPPPWAPLQPPPPWCAPGAHVVWSPATDRWGFWWFNDWYSL